MIVDWRTGGQRTPARPGPAPVRLDRAEQRVLNAQKWDPSRAPSDHLKRNVTRGFPSPRERKAAGDIALVLKGERALVKGHTCRTREI